MAANDELTKRLHRRLDVMNDVVKLSNLTGDDQFLLQECYQRLRTIEKLQDETCSLLRVHEERKNEASGMSQDLERLLSLANYINAQVTTKIAEAVAEAKVPKSRLPPTPTKPRRVDASAAGAANTAGVAYVTDEEFDHVPKYMKGRQSVQTLNKCVDQFNKTVAAKYDLLSRPKSQLRDAHWSKIIDYKAQETKETVGAKFVTESDLRAKGGLFETSKAVTNFVVIMRHCGRLREIRGHGFVRFAIQ